MHKLKFFGFVLFVGFVLAFSGSDPGRNADLVYAASRAESGGGASIQVYDAAGQYLGVLVGRGKMQDDVMIFIPALHKFTTVKQSTGQIESTSLTFESPDCQGTAYLPGGVDTIYNCAGKYYVGGTRAHNILRTATQTYQGACVNWSPEYDKLADMFQAKDLAETEIPFTLPVALPLRYEYE